MTSQNYKTIGRVSNENVFFFLVNGRSLSRLAFVFTFSGYGLTV